MSSVQEFKKAYTDTYWVTFNGPLAAGCITCNSDEDPLKVAAALGPIRTIDSLPYPARPVLRRPEGEQYPCPEFCHAPNQCKGRTACPQNYACSE